MGTPIGKLESQSVTVGGTSIHARVSQVPGAVGLPIVLVHGLLVSSRYMVPTATRLAPRWRVYAPDLPGYGKSGKPVGALNVPELADALAGYLAAAGIERAALVANSFGCQIATDLAARYPARVDRLVLLGPTVDPSTRPGVKLAGLWLFNGLFEPASLLLVIARDLMDMGVPRFYATYQHMLRDRIEAKVPHIQAPALIVRGERDTTVGQQWVQTLANLAPHARVAVIRGAPHTVNFSAPGAVAELVEAFLAEAAIRP